MTEASTDPILGGFQKDLFLYCNDCCRRCCRESFAYVTGRMKARANDESVGVGRRLTKFPCKCWCCDLFVVLTNDRKLYRYLQHSANEGSAMLLLLRRRNNDDTWNGRCGSDATFLA